MRLNGNLLRQVKPLPGTNQTMWDYLSTDNFEAVVDGTLLTASAVMEDVDDLLKPSNAIKLGFDIKRKISIKKALAIMNNDDASHKEAEDFRLIMETFWATKITKLARVLLLERQFNKKVKLPEHEDLVQMTKYLQEQVEGMDLSIKTPENFKHVADIVSAKLTMYDRRRPGEMENAR